jgi:hypothetical protein
MPRRLLTVVLAVVLGLSTFAYRYLSFEDFSNDHFVHLSQALQITRGALPVRDFVERGIPLMSLVSAAAQVTIGEGLRAEVFLVAGAYGLAAALTLLLTVGLSRSLTVGLLTGLIPTLIFPVSYSYPKILVYAAGLLAGLYYCEKPTWPRAVGVAAAIAAAFLFRHDHGVVLGFASVVLLLVRHGATRAAALAVGRTLLLTAALVSPFLLWVQFYQGVGDYLRQGVAFSRREAERGDAWWTTPGFRIDRSQPLWTPLGQAPVINVRWRDNIGGADIASGERRHGLRRLDPVGPHTWQYELRTWSPSALKELVQDPDVADTQGVDRSAFLLQVPHPTGLRVLLTRMSGPGEGLRFGDNGVAVWFYAVWVLPLVSFATLALRWKNTRVDLRSTVAAAIATQLAMNVLMLRDPLDTRIRDVVVPSVALASFVAGLTWQARGGSAGRGVRRTLTVAMVVVLVAVSGAVGDAARHLEATNAAGGVEGVRLRLRQLRRVVLPASSRTGPVGERYRSLVAYLDRCTAPSSRLLAMTFAPEVFFYSGRMFAGGQVSMTPGYFVTDADASLMLERLAREDVPLVIMDSETQGEMDQQFPRVTALVRSRYREVGTVPLATEKRLILLADSSRPVTDRFGTTGLPCFVR